MNSFSHLDKDGRINMVDVGNKKVTHRTAVAEGKIYINHEIYKAIKNDEVKKGNVLNTAEIAGIMAAKKVPEMIPLCHQLNLSKVDVKAELKEKYVRIESFVRCEGKTGVEMEALQAVNTALLTVYDMCKAMGKDMEISNVHLLEKTGGKSGKYKRKKK
ncbi:MAG: cyclic pyranopterin monophosphate synthase MoaC [Candidatus Mcinerneyibacterium aminivorans]|uniref:Cyclic pyranopterin monophosphate synthase n=1 Tax=Candidatus Mcinerneyibacterium aminivorans TaxID=2703815 RepID=A0A5D0MJP4_9BACT|nr:MAG: cyclic pyranopterin monophosphate synthase MoaC [Candidatus Mcinerneyibacterium aminivorans]